MLVKELADWQVGVETPACLLVDAGNTQIKAMVAGGGMAPQRLWQRPREWWLQGLALEHDLQGFFVKHPQVRHLALSNVLGQAMHGRLQAWCERHGVQFFCTAANNHPQLQTCYDTPSLLGQDRWSAALAVALSSQAPCNLVLSMGTATTLDAVVCRPESQGPWVHLGGMIVPGPGTMLAAMASHAVQLPKLALEGESSAIALQSKEWPTNTEQAMLAGVVAMHKHYVLGMARGLSAQHGGWPVQCWVLGGYAEHPAFASLGVDLAVVHWPWAVFFGLFAAWQHRLLGGV